MSDLLNPKTKALAALIRYGDSAPPAPREFIAFHRPGARNPTPPMMKALKSVLRCQTRFSGKVETSSGEPDEEIESVMFTCLNIPILDFLPSLCNRHNKNTAMGESSS